MSARDRIIDALRANWLTEDGGLYGKGGAWYGWGQIADAVLSASSAGETPPEVLAIECPVCRTWPGWECLNRATGDDREQPHPARIRAARDEATA